MAKNKNEDDTRKLVGQIGNSMCQMDIVEATAVLLTTFDVWCALKDINRFQGINLFYGYIKCAEEDGITPISRNDLMLGGDKK